MEKYEKSLCKICLGVIHHGNFRVTEEIIGEVSDILLLKLSAQQKSVLAKCEACSTKLFAAFNFKAACMNTEDSIFPYINSERGTPIDLREVYLKERGKEHLKDILEDERICRLCMQVVTCDFTPVDEVDVSVLSKFIPEVNFSSTKENVICKICVDLLDIHTSFLNNISYEKEIINDICKDVTESLSNIKCEEIEIKSEDNDSDNPLPTLKDELGDCASECRFKYVERRNNSTLKRKKVGQGPEGKYDGLKRNKKKRSGSGSDEQIYKCESCDYQSGSKYNLAHHQLKHKNTPEDQINECHSCNYKTIYRKRLATHLLEHIPQNTYKCDMCDYKTKQKRYFDNHQLTHKDISEVQKYKCDTCDYETKRKRNLKNHLLKHKNIPEEQMFKCDLCEYKSKWKIYLANHRLRHDIPEKQMYKCDSCDYITFYKNSFNRHQLIHKDVPEEKMFKCDSCAYKAKQKVNLKKHQLRHKYIPEDKMFKCELCDYKTRVKCLLTRHQLTHKKFEDHMYKCASCDYTTNFKQSLAQHQLKHRYIPDEQKFKCDLCDFKTRLKKYLTKHQRRHKDFPEAETCDLCDYKTGDRYHLSRHQLTHKYVKDQMYKCHRAILRPIISSPSCIIS